MGQKTHARAAKRLAGRRTHVAVLIGAARAEVCDGEEHVDNGVHEPRAPDVHEKVRRRAEHSIDHHRPEVRAVHKVIDGHPRGGAVAGVDERPAAAAAVVVGSRRDAVPSSAQAAVRAALRRCAGASASHQNRTNTSSEPGSAMACALHTTGSHQGRAPTGSPRASERRATTVAATEKTRCAPTATSVQCVR